MRILIDRRESDFQDVAARSLVLLEHDALRGRETTLKFFEGRARRAAKAVDGLIRISDSKDVLLRSAEQLRQCDVAGVAILEFIDQDVARALAFLLQELGIGL